MLRVAFIMCLSHALAACSMGHVALPFAQATSPARAAAGQPPSLPAARGKTGLGGPTDAAGSNTQVPRTEPALALINDLRSARGLPPLTASAELDRAAAMQAANLSRTGVLDHIGPDGSTPIDRVRTSGFRPTMAAENIASGQTSLDEALRSWRESDAHLRNLLLAEATHMGIAHVDDPRTGRPKYWTLVLAAGR